MNLLVTGWIIAATTCVSLAILQLLIWMRRRSEPCHAILSMASLGAAAVAVSEIRMSGATSVEQFVSAFKMSNYGVVVLLIGLAWFAVTYSGSRHRTLVWLATGGWTLCGLINLARPLGLTLSEVTGLETVTTSWGENYTVAVAATDATKTLADLSAVLVMLVSLQSFFTVWRTGQRRKGGVLAAISLFLALALAHTNLVDFGILDSPYLISYFFLGIVLVTSYELAADVAKASVLSERVRADESRWRSLLEGVELLVARVGPDGIIRYANPYLSQVSGYSVRELTGRHIKILLPESEQKRLLPRLEDAGQGELEPSFAAKLATKSGTHRIIVWRSVLFTRSEGEPLEVLSVGIDVTERREAERARDQAIEEVEKLKSQLEEENLYLKEEIKLEGAFQNIVGESEPLKYVLFRVEQVAPADTTVLIQGETGVGKELVARAVHERSRRSKSPFIRLNCAALPANLVESELFGHVAGAFTDARTRRVGRFELANHGTLFLDEVSELPLELQPKLLRVLQDGEFEPVGSSETRQTDVRLIAATNRKLEDEVRKGKFREDLYYRLHVYPITVPPLRDRRHDIPLLIERFLPRINAKVGKNVREVPSGVLRALQDYSWPGNIRQLQNLLEESVVTSTGSVLRIPGQLGGDGPLRPSGSFKTLAQAERDLIAEVLVATDGQVGGAGGAAEILEINPNTLRSRMNKLGISAKDLGPSGRSG